MSHSIDILVFVFWLEHSSDYTQPNVSWIVLHESKGNKCE